MFGIPLLGSFRIAETMGELQANLLGKPIEVPSPCELYFGARYLLPQ
jgi:hypothetical protein